MVKMTVYRMIERGDLSATKIGKVYRIHKNDLMRTLEKKS
ncbi:DNA-binding protein [Klebsiella pneumoniae]|nr:DNA-binding protein [Klebsiella pneumoniae]